MGSMGRCSASLLCLLLGLSCAWSEELRERDARCGVDGCFVVHFQPKTFLDSWRACKDRGGDLATIKRNEDAANIAALFFTLDLRHSRTNVQVWIGLQRQPRQCSSTRPLRGFSWTTGDQDTLYTNWQQEDSASMCLVPRCVVMSYSTDEQTENFTWLDTSCSSPVDGFLCHYASEGACPPLWNEGAGSALYATPFNLLSNMLTHVPFGSVATIPCPAGAKEGEESVSCMLREDGVVGWSREPPLCSESALVEHRCDHANGGCHHYCRPTGSHFYCECAAGYQLGEDGQSCEQFNACQRANCEFECLPIADSFRCACPDGYMLAADERGCLDVDECLQSPCEQLCENALGSFQCQCRTGYFLDDLGGCEDVDECMSDPCEHACENTAGSHVCHCHLGYSAAPEEPSRCQDVDECQDPRSCEQMCVNYVGSFDCYCEEGYQLLADRYSCQRPVDRHATLAPPFPWVSPGPGPPWDLMEYDWDPEQRPWPVEEEQHVEWQTNSPQKSDVIWVTSTPHHGGLPLTQDPEEDQTKEDNLDFWEGATTSQVLLNFFPSISTPAPLDTAPPSPTPWPPSTPSPTPSLSPDWSEEDEDVTTPLPLPSTSTVSGGAWNWWVELPAASPGLGGPAGDKDSSPDRNMWTDSGDYDLAREDKEDTPLGAPTVPSLPPTTQQTLDEDILDPTQEDRGQTKSPPWLLVGLLVPIGILIVVMVALGSIYCSRCWLQPQDKSAPACYHWTSGAHDGQAAPHPSAGGKALV